MYIQNNSYDDDGFEELVIIHCKISSGFSNAMRCIQALLAGPGIFKGELAVHTNDGCKCHSMGGETTTIGEAGASLGSGYQRRQGILELEDDGLDGSKLNRKRRRYR